MTNKLLITIVSIYLLCISAAADHGDWRKTIASIHLLKSTRESIRATLGKSEANSLKYVDYFKIDGAEVRIVYSDGDCNGPESQWDVPEYTVVRFSIYFTKKVKLSDLPFKLDGFSRRMVSDVPNAYYYYNNTRGIDFTLKRNKAIEGVSFTPPDSLIGRRCVKGKHY